MFSLLSLPLPPQTRAPRIATVGGRVEAILRCVDVACATPVPRPQSSAVPRVSSVCGPVRQWKIRTVASAYVTPRLCRHRISWTRDEDEARRKESQSSEQLQVLVACFVPFPANPPPWTHNFSSRPHTCQLSPQPLRVCGYGGQFAPLCLPTCMRANERRRCPECSTMQAGADYSTRPVFSTTGALLAVGMLGQYIPGLFDQHWLAGWLVVWRTRDWPPQPASQDETVLLVCFVGLGLVRHYAGHAALWKRRSISVRTDT